MKRLLIGIITFSMLALLTAGIILYGRGYHFDFENKTVNSTGSLVLTSFPDGASVFINGQFNTATNNTIPMSPGWYDIKITKQGYSPWQKKMRVDPEVVAKTDALLFPINPSLSPLTTFDVKEPVVSPDGTKIAFISVNKNEESLDNLNTDSRREAPLTRSGIYILDINDGLLTLNRFSTLILDFNQLPNFSPNNELTANSQQPTAIIWSPDSKQVLYLRYKNSPVVTPTPSVKTTKTIVTSEPNPILEASYLLDATKLNNTVIPLIGSFDDTIEIWKKQKEVKEHEFIISFPKAYQAIATQSAKIIAFSPDETKVLYEATKSTTIAKAILPPLIGSNTTEEQRTITPGNIYVYDVKEDKNFFIMESGNKKQEAGKSINTTTQTVANNTNQTVGSWELGVENSAAKPPLQWYPDSRHLIYVEPESVTVMDYDGSNRVSVYAGPFQNSFVVPWPSGGRIVILTTLNVAGSSKPSLYTVNIR